MIFTCPKCGSHFFGTFKYHDVMGKSPASTFHNKGFVHGEYYGQCNRHQYENTDCRFTWHRSPAEDAVVIKEEQWPPPEKV